MSTLEEIKKIIECSPNSSILIDVRRTKHAEAIIEPVRYNFNMDESNWIAWQKRLYTLEDIDGKFRGKFLIINIRKRDNEKHHITYHTVRIHTNNELENAKEYNTKFGYSHRILCYGIEKGIKKKLIV